MSAKQSPKNPHRHLRLLVAIGLIAGLLPAMNWTVIAAGTPGFSIGLLDGWSGGTMPISTDVDQAVDQSAPNVHTGQSAWRISNKKYNGNFDGWVFGPGLAVSAGQPSSGAGADQFKATLWFRSASASADGSNIEIDLGTVAGNDRNTFLALTNKANDAGGLQLRANEFDVSTGDWLPIVRIASGITRSEWHRLDIVANFYDGPGNDTVEYALDGIALPNPAGGQTFGTFETYRAFESSPYALSNRLFFRSGAAPSGYNPASVDADAQGFYFDDVKYSVANQATPGRSRAAYATGFEPTGMRGSLRAAYATGFETGMSAGSIHGLEGWSGGAGPISPTVDQSVDKSAHNGRSGQGAWKISNNNSLGGYYGPFTGWAFGPGLPVSAGPPSSGAGADRFRATLWFRSASASADGSNIEIDLGSELGEARNTYLALTNMADGAPGGLQLLAGEPDPATGEFRDIVPIATGITRSGWHRLDIVAKFRDGSANHTVEYALDGVALANPAGGVTFGTLERWYEKVEARPYVLSNRLFFRTKRAPSFYGAFDDAAAQGFYFDDLSYSVANQGPTFNGGSDFDGDGKADVAAFHPNGTWSIVNSGTGPAEDFGFGGNDDVSVTGDFNGDGKKDIGIFRPSDGTWYIRGMINAFQWGTAGDVPAPGDYDGDRKTDFAVFRPSEGRWYIAYSSAVANSFVWGTKGDVPVPGDYDGDGKTDLALYRPSEGNWYIAYSSTGSTTANSFRWGAEDDVLVPGDYDGDGMTDLATFRPSEGNWYIAYSSTGYTTANSFRWGAADEDLPMPGDYDGDGMTDVATFRPSDGTWYILQSSNGTYFGITMPKLLK